MSLPASAVRVPSEQNGMVSPQLLISMVGCILGFLVITVGFLIVARKKPRMSTFPTSTLPLAHNHHAHQPTRRGVALPVATAAKCLAYSQSSRKVLEPLGASYESLRSLAPLPPHTRYAPTGVSAIRPETWRSAASSESSAASPTTPSTTPSSPSTPPPMYMGRGPTASFRRSVS